MTRKRVIRNRPSAARKVTCSFGAARLVDLGLAVAAVLDEEEEDPQPDQRDREGDEEDGVVLARELGEQDEGGERAEHRADRVERAVHAEGAAQAGALAVERDQRVARSGADALAEAVDEQHGGRPQPCAAHRDEAELAQRRRAVAGGGDLLVALLAVGHEAAQQAHERGGALVHAVDEAELQRAEPDLVGQVQRQDGGDHLLREVGEEADEAEQDDGPRDRDPASAGARRRGRDDLGRHVAHGGVHARITRPRTADLHEWTGRIDSDTASFSLHRHARDVVQPVQPPPADVDRGPGATGTPQGQYASGPPSERLSDGAPGRERPAPARRRATRRWAAGRRRRRRRPPRARRRPRC